VVGSSRVGGVHANVGAPENRVFFAEDGLENYSLPLSSSESVEGDGILPWGAAVADAVGTLAYRPHCVVEDPESEPTDDGIDDKSALEEIEFVGKAVVANQVIHSHLHGEDDDIDGSCSVDDDDGSAESD
jgi:hypothetical protein